MQVQKTVALVIGAVLTLVGIVGFFTNGAVLWFDVNALHNIIHIVSGLAAIGFGLVNEGVLAHLFNKWFGVVYLVVGVLGFVAGDLLVTLINANLADHILHLVLGAVLAGVGFGVDE